MKQGYVKAKRTPYHERTEADFTWFARRKFSRLATVCEVWLRYDMGSRYLNFPVFAGTLLALVAHRFILTFFGKMSDIPSLGVGAGGYYFDWFIGSYVLMSLYHFIQHYRNRAKGREIYSHSMGESRLFFIARALRIRNVRYITYVVIEPLCVFLMIPLVLFYSPYLAFLNLLAAFWLCFDNSKNMVYSRQLELDRSDSEIFAREALEVMERTERVEQPLPTHRAHEPPIQLPPKPAFETSIPSVEEVMQSFQEGDKSTIS